VVSAGENQAGKTPKTGQKVTLIRSLGCFDATMIGVGAMIGAGIFVLTGMAAGEAGPASILAFALNGIVTMFTAATYAELSSKIPESGGGYSFVKKAFPGLFGFLSGWMLWFAYIVACCLYALGFAGYLWEVLERYAPTVAAGMLGIMGTQVVILVFMASILGFFVWLNVRGTGVTGTAESVMTLAKIVILLIFVGFGLKAVVAAPAVAAANFNPFFPKGFGGVLVAMGLTFIAFEGYDLIATVAEEIKDPTKNIPRATYISVAISVAIYLMILFVCIAAVSSAGMTSWEFLGEYQETAIVMAAENFMPGVGVVIIVIGGLLSTMSALNATVLASSRVAFTLGRDRWLPAAMANIHPKNRTPHVAILATGVLVLLMGLSLPIQVVGSAASLLFLLVFAAVNLAAIRIRNMHPELSGGYRAPFFPWLPILGILSNISLAIYQFTFNPQAWYVAIGWIAAGAALYQFYLKGKAADAAPRTAVPAFQPPPPASDFRILIPLANPDNIPSLLRLAIPMAKRRGGDVIVTNIITVPGQLPLHEGMEYVDTRSKPLFEIADRVAAELDFPLHKDLRIAHKVENGILSAAEEYAVDQVMMGWKGFSTKKERIFGEATDRLLQSLRADVAVVRFRSDPPYERILLPTSGGPHAEFAAELIEPMVHETGSKVTSCFIVPKNADETTTDRARKWMDRTTRHAQLGRIEKTVVRSSNVVSGIVKEGRNHDLIVLGASNRKLFSYLMFGEIPEAVAEIAEPTVMLVRRVTGPVLPWFDSRLSGRRRRG
jgi:amino acid transporter/nucleotide-binding universal stress UspA family protein